MAKAKTLDKDAAILDVLSTIMGRLDNLESTGDSVVNEGAEYTSPKKKATTRKGNKQELNMSNLCGTASYKPKDDSYAAMICIDIEDERPLMMGVKKIAKILANAEAIETVIKKHYTIVE